MKRLTVVLAGGAIAASLAVGMLAAPLTAPTAAGDPHEGRPSALLAQGDPHEGRPSALLAQGDPHEYAGQPASLAEYAHPVLGGTTEVCGFYNCGIGWM
ncbi:MAG: hypothetical protein M0Z46_20155 [Actinomycetota bacterium]|nr:hypothetical protein [Actinomycetota bacterium]